MMHRLRARARNTRDAPRSRRISERLRRRVLRAVVAAASCFLAVALAQHPAAYAADYPTKPIRFLVGFPPGAGTDLIGRIVGQALAEALKVSVIIDNRGGASGIIAADLASKAPPDGYTLLLANSGAITVGPNLRAKMPYDPRRDFAPVGMIGSYPNALVIPMSSSLRSVKDLIEAARRQPGKLNYGSSGIGTTLHMSGELLQHLSGARMTHVAYKGGATQITDLISGRIDFAFAGVPSVLAHIKSDRVRALAVTGETRSAQLADIPTVAESGFPGYRVLNWFGLLLPRNAPGAIVDKLNLTLNNALRTPGVLDQFSSQGVTAQSSTPAQFGVFVSDELSTWKTVVKAANIQPE